MLVFNRRLAIDVLEGADVMVWARLKSSLLVWVEPPIPYALCSRPVDKANVELGNGVAEAPWSLQFDIDAHPPSGKPSEVHV